MKIDLTNTAPENCLHFDECQVNDCPLEPKPNNYKTLSEDKKLFNYHKCRYTKKKRMEIAKAYKMKSLGLTLKELDNLRKSMRMRQQMFSTRKDKIETAVTHKDLEGMK